MGRAKRAERDVLRALLTECRRQKVVFIRCAFMPGVEAGWPDVLLLPKGGRPVFVELKRPGGALSKLQKFRAQELQRLAYRVLVVDTVEEARAVAKKVCEAGSNTLVP